MSLLTSVTQESAGIPSFVEAAYTAGGSPMIATASGAGIVRIQSSTGNITRLRGAAPATTLSLGLDGGVNPNAIVVTSGPDLTTIATNTTCSQGLTVTGAAILNGSLDTFSNRDIHGYSDTGYVSTFISRVGAGVVANPVPLPQGLYSVMVVPENPGNEAAQASTCCYWNGAAWSGNGVSFNFTAGAPNVAIGPAAGGATLEIGGASIPAGNLIVNFRQLLAAPNL